MNFMDAESYANDVRGTNIWEDDREEEAEMKKKEEAEKQK